MDFHKGHLVTIGPSSIHFVFKALEEQKLWYKSSTRSHLFVVQHIHMKAEKEMDNNSLQALYFVFSPLPCMLYPDLRYYYQGFRQVYRALSYHCAIVACRGHLQQSPQVVFCLKRSRENNVSGSARDWIHIRPLLLLPWHQMWKRNFHSEQSRGAVLPQAWPCLPRGGPISYHRPRNAIIKFFLVRLKYCICILFCNIYSGAYTWRYVQSCLGGETDILYLNQRKSIQPFPVYDVI